jgi:hypothetical protein
MTCRQHGDTNRSRQWTATSDRRSHLRNSPRRKSCLLADSMIRASTSCRSTSSPPMARSKPSTSNARHSALYRCPIRDEAIPSGPPQGSPAPKPRSSSSRLAAAAAAPRRDLERRQLSVIVRRAEVLNAPRAAPGGVHDPYCDRSRGRLHRADVRHPTRLRAPASAQIHRSAPTDLQATTLYPSEPRPGDKSQVTWRGSAVARQRTPGPGTSAGFDA